MGKMMTSGLGAREARDQKEATSTRHFSFRPRLLPRRREWETKLSQNVWILVGLHNDGPCLGSFDFLISDRKRLEIEREERDQTRQAQIKIDEEKLDLEKKKTNAEVEERQERLRLDKERFELEKIERAKDREAATKAQMLGTMSEALKQGKSIAELQQLKELLKDL